MPGEDAADSGRGDHHDDLLDWWECATCGETGNSGVESCPSCGGMQIGLHTGDVDLPPCWKEDTKTAVHHALRLWRHLDGPGFIGLVDGDTVELVRADLRVGEEPDPETRPATAENVRELAEAYNDEWFDGSPQAGGADA